MKTLSFHPRLRFILVIALVLGFVLAASASCEEYEAPPRPVVQGLASGVLTDPRAPLVIDFGTPIDPATLSVKLVLLEADVEGNLRDEDADPDTELKVLARLDLLEGDIGGRGELSADGRQLRLVLESALPVGPQLMLLIEGGLRGTSGRVMRNRARIPLTYVVQCSASGSTFQNGYYFVLLDVEAPLGTQIQLLAYIDVDPATGGLVSKFTNADRNPAQQCPMPCGGDLCRLLPAPECVPPSTRAGTADEYPDFIPNEPPPVGYSFLVEGCAVANGNANGVLTAPATMVVQSPPVTVEGLTMTAQFAAGSDGLVRASGSLTADVVRLGPNALGPGRGSMTAVRIPDDRVPPNIPRPNARADAGAAPTSDAGP